MTDAAEAETYSAEEDVHFAKSHILLKLRSLAAYRSGQDLSLFDISVGLLRDLFELGRLRRPHPTLAQQPCSEKERPLLVHDAESHLLPERLDGVPLSHTSWAEANRKDESY